MSDTPRTDSQAMTVDDYISPITAQLVYADFARQLERELSEAREGAERNRKDAERYRFIRDHDWDDVRITNILFAESVSEWDDRLDDLFAAMKEGK